MKLKPYEILDVSFARFDLLLFALKFPRLTNFTIRLLRPLYVEKETWYNQTLRYGLLALNAGLSTVDELKAFKHGIQALREECYEGTMAGRRGESLAWVEWILTAEIFEAFDVPSWPAEAINIFGNIRGVEYPPYLVEVAENAGIPIENCSAQKLLVGCMLTEQMAPPSMIVSASHPCDTGVSVYQSVEYLTNVPMFVFDCPYWKDDDSYQYYVENMWDFIAFLEKNLEKKIDWDKLREALDRVNKFNYYLQEMTEMHRAIPCPGSTSSLILSWVFREGAMRSPHAVEAAKELYQTVKKRFDNGQGVVKKEKIRVIWWDPTMAFFLYLFKWMEDEFGAVVVTDFVGRVSQVPIDTSTPESMVEGMAKTQMHLAMGRQCHGPIEFVTGELAKCVEEYQPDCIIFSRHNGCKHGWSALRIAQDYVKKINMPALFLSIDIMDKRHTSEQEIKRQIGEFFRRNGLA
ncbi:MAG: 2-hydroxyacyl-CoA dehydratase subunit D [Ignavibacteriales bacterium]